MYKNFYFRVGTAGFFPIEEEVNEVVVLLFIVDLFKLVTRLLVLVAVLGRELVLELLNLFVEVELLILFDCTLLILLEVTAEVTFVIPPEICCIDRFIP